MRSIVIAQYLYHILFYNSLYEYKILRFCNKHLVYGRILISKETDARKI